MHTYTHTYMQNGVRGDGTANIEDMSIYIQIFTCAHNHANNTTTHTGKTDFAEMERQISQRLAARERTRHATHHLSSQSPLADLSQVCV